MVMYVVFLVLFYLAPWRGISAHFQGHEQSSNHRNHFTQTDKDREESRLRSVIPLIDINGDGRVSVEELAARTDKSMKAFYKDEANTRLKSLDTNDDGKVSWDEYTESAEKKGAFTAEQRKRDRRRFGHADVDKDGGLSRDELISMFHPEENPHMFTVIVGEFLEFVDGDKDGFLSFDEYKVKTVNGANKNLRTAEQSFKKLDQDQDGKLNKAEMKVWLSAVSTSSQARNQAQHLVNIADDNKDGVLEQEEMVAHMELFTAGNKGYQSGQNIKQEL
ncbi:calumenin-B-like [Porites lutea]|uniref:calumenin-B-like n=1 Tax=Porites lutea TaxID=51062 RepID=UPI003CC5F1EF